MINQVNPLFELEMKLDKSDHFEFENSNFQMEKERGSRKCLYVATAYLILLTGLSAYLTYKVFALQGEIHSCEHQQNGTSEFVSLRQEGHQEVLSLLKNTTLEASALRRDMEELNTLVKGQGGIRLLQEQLNLVNISTRLLQSQLDNLSVRPGVPGPRGPKGDTGEAGARGSKGEQGIKGNAGLLGIPGMKGEKGLQGEQEILDKQLLTLLNNSRLEGSSLRGDIQDLQVRFTDLCEGSGGINWLKLQLGNVNISTQLLKIRLDSLSLKSGPPGPMGPKGVPGVTGVRGPKGDQGMKGSEGRQGIPGIKGQNGQQGNQGIKGDRGLQGLRGEPGAKGEKGISGTSGARGLQGEKGVKGEKGETGQRGLPANIRIVGGGSQGRVEVFYKGEWGTICDDSFDITDGGVICRMLGYQRAVSVSTGPAGSGRIWLDDLNCTGSESSIFDCRGTTTHNCSHSEDAAVSCV
ncbi:macrophage receptor MARCO isoform X2 [Brienomyrus brachyistius]|uniref:macrophage receptor MARCO isoform X2 n=1 Tax=Brienomyrus brachyistius TaxID=42636 RepID=UPI0020B1A034|nr:macrophage receptor MARCO isoform X2 [Brienomyrus brachyistius]